jgi:soluble lytic murein transglycosylase
MLNTVLLSLVITYSNYYGIDPYISLAVIKTESQFKYNAVGQLGEIGLFQLRPEYFTHYKKTDLFNPEINIKLGIKHLARKKLKCKYHVDNTYVLCYNLGIAGAKKRK